MTDGQTVFNQTIIKKFKKNDNIRKSETGQDLFFHWYSIVFVYFSKGFPRREYVNIACSIILHWSLCNISLPARCLCL